MLRKDTFLAGFKKILKKTNKILSNSATQYQSVTDMWTVDTSTGTGQLYSLYSLPSSTYKYADS